MKKFFALFMTPAAVADEWRRNTKPEETESHDAAAKLFEDNVT